MQLIICYLPLCFNFFSEFFCRFKDLVTIQNTPRVYIEQGEISVLLAIDCWREKASPAAAADTKLKVDSVLIIPVAVYHG